MLTLFHKVLCYFGLHAIKTGTYSTGRSHRHYQHCAWCGKYHREWK